MKADRARYFAENMERLSRRDRVFLNNPVIVQGLGLAPIVIPTNTVHSAAIMAVAVALLLTPTRMIANFIAQRTGVRFRGLIYVLTAGALYFLVAMAIDMLYGLDAATLGIYLPLLVMEPLIIKRYESPKRERLVTSFKKGIVTTLGFCLVLFMLAGLRELLALGTLAGVEVFRAAIFPMAASPAGGFILLGFIAALWRGFVGAFKKNVSMGVKREQ